MALSDIFTPAADEPVRFGGNGNLALQQSAWPIEATERDRDSGVTLYTQAGHTGGQGVRLDTAGQTVEWDLTPTYDIPDSAVGIQVRDEADDTPGVTWTFNGNTIDTIPQSATSIALSWADVGSGIYDGTGYTGGPLSAGTTYTLKAECDAAASGEGYRIDHVAPYDSRYSYTWDDTTDANDALDGPELYPDAHTIPAETYNNELNVAAATLDVTLDDTSGSQAIQVSNDNGTTWYPADGTQTNTQSVSVDFMANQSYGTAVGGRVTLSRYGSQTSTPTQGHLGQTLQSWTLSIDTNTLSVIDESEYVGSHLENLQALAGDGGMLFVPDYQDGPLALEAFQPGQVTRVAPWDENKVISRERVETTEGYANKQTVYGAVDQSTGERLTVTSESQAEINQHGVVEAPPIFEPRLDSPGDLKSIARTRLAERIANDRITGSITIPPTYVMPGYSYDVPSLARSGETAPTLTLQRVEFGDGVDAPEGRLNFEAASELAGALSTISSDVRSVKRAVK